MKIINFFKTCSFLIFLIVEAASYPSEHHPTVDKASLWSVGSFSNGELRDVSKWIRTNNTTTESRGVFYSIKFLNLRNGSTTYTVTTDYEYTEQLGLLRCDYAGWYKVDGTDWKIFICYRLWNSGQIDIMASWSENWPSDHYFYKFGFDVDYDLAGSSGDIVEYQIKENDVPQWYAPANATWSDHYDRTNIVTGSGALDGNWLVRCADATSPSNQLQLYWGSRYESNLRYDFYFRTYESSIGALQDVYDDIDSKYQQYAYRGKDQKMEIWMFPISYTLNPDNRYYTTVTGMLVQKPNGRSLEIRTNVMTGAQTPDLFLTVDNGRTVADALGELTSYKYSNYTVTNLPDPYTGDMTLSQVHNFMTSNTSYSPINSTDAQMNMRDWKVSVNVVNHNINSGRGPCMGIMFDYRESDVSRYDFGADLNNIAREGVAISWPSCVEGPTHFNSSWTPERYLAFTFIHELGHCFNMLHEWSDCGEDDYASPRCDRDNRTIMSYGPMSTTGSTTMTWSEYNLNWYRFGPESWVKPGRLGTAYCDWYGRRAKPHYEPYQY